MELQETLEHGKSTVCQEFLKLSNAKIIDADRVAKSLDFSGSEYVEEIKKVFGQEVINEKNTLNREALGDIIYHNFQRKLELDKITFQFVLKAIDDRIKELSKEELDYILIDAPLLFEAQMNDKCHFVISVIAKEKIKIDRICSRDNLNAATAKSRLSVQKDDEFFKENSDFVIKNNENIEEMRKDIERILNSIESRRI